MPSSYILMSTLLAQLVRGMHAAVTPKAAASSASAAQGEFSIRTHAGASGATSPRRNRRLTVSRA